MIRSIRRRSIVAMMLIIALTTATYGGVAFVVSERVEDTLLNTMIERESDFLSELIRRERIIELPQSKQTRAWYERPGHIHVPMAFAGLPLGISHDVSYDDDLFHVQRTAVEGGVLTIALEITSLEAREHQFQSVMIIGGLLISGLALLAALGLSRRVAEPILQLSRELKDLEPDELDRRFAARYQAAEIHGVAEALDHYMERMGRMVERERGFAAAASHEIRSPLTVIRSALELADFDDSLSVSTRRTLTRARRAAEGLGVVMDGLFELAREPVAAPEFEGFNAASIVAQVLSEVATTTAIRERLNWREPESAVVLRASEAHWRILVRNLVDNAINHAPNGPIDIVLDASRLSVRDYGPGIDPNVMPHLFERSRRGVESGGAGLGLYIVRELVERQGWTLSVRNERSGGCRFTVGFMASSGPQQSDDLSLTVR